MTQTALSDHVAGIRAAFEAIPTSANPFAEEQWEPAIEAMDARLASLANGLADNETGRCSITELKDRSPSHWLAVHAWEWTANRLWRELRYGSDDDAEWDCFDAHIELLEYLEWVILRVRGSDATS